MRGARVYSSACSVAYPRMSTGPTRQVCVVVFACAGAATSSPTIIATNPTPRITGATLSGTPVVAAEQDGDGDDLHPPQPHEQREHDRREVAERLVAAKRAGEAERRAHVADARGRGPDRLEHGELGAGAAGVDQ